MKQIAASALSWLRDLPYRGSGSFCPVCCRESRRFAPGGVVPRPGARCVHCGSLERHRLLWRYLEDRTDLLQSRARVLHFAPEQCISTRLSAIRSIEYISADIVPGRAMVEINLTAMSYPSAHFDVILCSHVLEHIPDDLQAMREMARVLKPTGWALLIVPIAGGTTIEDPLITDPRERLRRFGQENHVRLYGRDFAGRLEASGFAVEVVLATDFITARDLAREGIPTHCHPIHRAAPIPSGEGIQRGSD